MLGPVFRRKTPIPPEPLRRNDWLEEADSGQSLNVSSALRSAGYDRIGFERFAAGICTGRDLVEAIDFAMALGREFRV